MVLCKRSKTTYLAEEGELEQPTTFVRPSNEDVRTECLSEIYDISVARWSDLARMFVFIPKFPDISVSLLLYSVLELLYYLGSLLLLADKTNDHRLVIVAYNTLWFVTSLMFTAEQFVDVVNNGKKSSHWFNDKASCYGCFFIYLVMYSMMFAIGLSTSIQSYSAGSVMIMGIVGSITTLMPILLVLSGFFVRAVVIENFVTDVHMVLNWIEWNHVKRINKQISDLNEIRSNLQHILAITTEKSKLFTFEHRHRSIILKYLNVHAVTNTKKVINIVSCSELTQIILENEFFEVTVRINNEPKKVKLKFKYEENDKNVKVLVIETEHEIDVSFFVCMLEKQIFSEIVVSIPNYSSAMHPADMSRSQKRVMDKLLGIQNDA